jgi:hypothetical protein
LAVGNAHPTESSCEGFGADDPRGVCSLLAPSLGGERAIPETRGFQSDSLFHFTISPNDRWLVYFEKLTPEQIGTHDIQYGNLRILDLETGELRQATLAEGQAPNSLFYGDASWAPDSSHCLLPPPQAVPWDPRRGILIDFQQPKSIRVVSTRVQYRDSPSVEVADEQYELLPEYTCPDCSPHSKNVEVMKTHVNASYLDLEASALKPNAYAEQIVAPDGKRIYFQKGAQSERVAA